MKPFLIIARVGDKSLHQRWLLGAEPLFDSFLSYFGDTPDKYRDEATYYEQAKGGKWPELARIIADNWAVISQYQAVWLPDDDLLIDAKSINKMFCFVQAFELDMSQPALSRNSYFSHPEVLQQPGRIIRFTNFVEVMAPVFSQRGLAAVRQSFAQSPSGWGLDNLWPKLLAKDSLIAIIDSVVVIHTRPVGGDLYKNNPELSPVRDKRYLETQYKELDINGRHFRNKFRVYGQFRWPHRGVGIAAFLRGKWQKMITRRQSREIQKYAP